MQTYPNLFSAIPDPKSWAGITINPQGCAAIEAERKRLGITPEVIERNQRLSLQRAF